MVKPGKFPSGKTEIPFEFPLHVKGNKVLYETYHGVFVNIQVSFPACSGPGGPSTENVWVDLERNPALPAVTACAPCPSRFPRAHISCVTIVFHRSPEDPRCSFSLKPLVSRALCSHTGCEGRFHCWVTDRPRPPGTDQLVCSYSHKHLFV